LEKQQSVIIYVKQSTREIAEKAPERKVERLVAAIEAGIGDAEYPKNGSA